MLLTTAAGPRRLQDAVNEGLKLWNGNAAEARSLAGLMIYLAWFADPIAMAGKLGHDESDAYKALLRVLEAVKSGKRVEIVGAGVSHCYLHLSGVAGFPQFVARMCPRYIMRSQDALAQLRPQDRDAHWLATATDADKSLCDKMPYLLVGADAWDTDVAQFPRPSMAKYGRVGAPGSPWWVAVAHEDAGGATH